MKIKWSFNNKSVENEFGVVVNLVNKRLSTLSIDSVQAHNSGEYKCTAKNKAGLVSYSKELNVNGTFLVLIFCMCSFQYHPLSYPLILVRSKSTREIQ